MRAAAGDVKRAECTTTIALTTSFLSSLSHTSKKNFANSSSDIGAPLIRMRSRTATRWGDVYRPA